MHATPEEIKAAYKKLAMKYHPDRNQGSKFHEEHFKKILEAYQTLSDKTERDFYDLRMFYNAARQEAASTETTQQTTRPNKGPDGDIYGTAGRYARGYQQQQNAKREYDSRPKDAPKTQPKWYTRAHYFVLLFWIIASGSMLFFWLNAAINHHLAAEALDKGDFETALEYDYKWGDAHLLKAKHFFYAQFPDYQRAIIHLELAKKYMSTPSGEVYKLIGDCYYQQAEFVSALINYTSALEQSPQDPEINLMLGKVNTLSLKRPDDGRKFLTEAIKFAKPNSITHFEALFAYAYSYLEDGNMIGAKSYFDKAAQSPHANSELFYLRGQTNYRLGNFIEACQDWDKGRTMGNYEATTQFDIKHCDFMLYQNKEVK